MPLRPDMILPPSNPLPDLDGLELHLMGVRGRGMTTFALAAAACGARVTGCDLGIKRSDGPLERTGIPVVREHSATHVADAHLVVATAVNPRFDESAMAADLGRLHHRSELLDALLRHRTSVTVTGTHGKGTVAAIVGMALVELGADPMVLLGASVPQINGPFRSGAGLAVAEADDADGSIARIHADVSVVTNSWFDHPVMGRTRRETIDAIAEHVAHARRAVILGRDAKLHELERHANVPVRRVGREVRVATRSVNAKERIIRLREPNGVVVEAAVHLLGGGVVDNMATAYLVLRELGYGPAESAGSLGALSGIERRLHCVGVANGVAVYDDLGKHPAAVAANLEALREVTSGCVHVMYEPFLHTDLVRWKSQWGSVLGRADSVTILPIDPTPGFPGEPTAAPDWPREVGLAATVVASRDAGIAHVAGRATPGDAVVVMGFMSDLTDVARRLADVLRS